jgi:hypothetical protein
MAKRHADNEELSHSDIETIVGHEVLSSVGYIDGTISRERSNALKYYRQEQYGNEQDGRSKVVTGDLLDTVEWMMPQIMRVFMAAEHIVTFEPENRDDEEAAEHKSNYVHHVFMRDNEGFQVSYDWIKDALLQKNGIIKIYWSETEESWSTRHTGLTEDDVAYMLTSEPGVEVAEQRVYEDRTVEQQVDEFGMPMPRPMLVDCTLRHTREIKKINVEGVPPEEFLISRESRSMEHGRLKAHRKRWTVSEAIAMGFKRDQVLSLAETGSYYGLSNAEHTARRHQEYEYPRTGAVLDESTREVVLVEAYMDLDLDGDNRSELVQVWLGGSSHELMMYEDETEGTDGYAYEAFGDPLPFVDITPIRMPHVFFGRSMFDLVGDLQLIHSTVLRQMLDNAYLVNNERTAIWEGKVDLSDMLTNRPGGVVRTQGPPGEVISGMPVQPIGQMLFPLLEYIEQQREGRSGVSRNAQGMDPEMTTNDTAFGLMKLMAAGQQRIELIARLFAETGFKRAMLAILKLSIAHQDKEREIRLNGEWVPVDPRYWQVTYDMSTEVGLGYESAEQEMLSINSILLDQEKIIQFQGGAQGPLVTLENVHEALAVKTKAAGLKRPQRFFTDPTSEEMMAMMQQQQQAAAQQEQPQDAALVLAQGQIQNDQQKIRVDAMKAQADAQDKQRAHEMAMQKAQADEAFRIREMELKYDIEREKIAANLDMKAAEIEANDEQNVVRLQAQADLQREKDAETFVREERGRMAASLNQLPAED